MELTVKQEIRKPGRPKVEGGRTRKQLLQVRLSDEEHTCILQAAHAQNTDKNKLVRGLVLNYLRTNTNLEGSITIPVGDSTIAVSKDEAKQILKSITEQLIGN